VDAAAHWGALNAGGRTVLVAATGLDKCYPDKNRDLFDRAARQGCVVTELLPGTPPRRDFFPTRNRIVVGLAQALVVIGGHLKSGTASAWQHMRNLGRPIVTWTGADPDRFELPAAIVAAGGLPLTEPNAELVLSRILQQRPESHEVYRPACARGLKRLPSCLKGSARCPNRCAGSSCRCG
jgi:DNA processing protein